ncbi:hypothetical protein [Bradyrhizobium sp. SZCCHNRI1009]|uniref:hypothetical protein n=1 Tax=unclassified Bradyrhizobium TaxID=2631580 RepID=UPI002916EAEA|nr:hypothetical protein [Bradyrhizobium sp. SZCCHNRI1009]
MMRQNPKAIDDDPTQALRARGVRLGQQQGLRLQWLSRTFGPLVHCDERPSPGRGRTIVLLDPPTGAGAELLYGTLTSHDAVAIPFGENPAFDFLKSKLTAFGTVGTSADGPHELWWGGRDWPAPETAPATTMRVVSCHPTTVGDLHVYHLRRSLQRLGLPFDIEAIDCRPGERLSAADKADFVARMWQRHREPLLYVEADVMFQAAPGLPHLAGCDFAVHKWNGWEMSPRTLYFGRSKAAETMLTTWREIASSYPDVWDGYLIDQAWSAVTSQIALDTVWLPRSYHAVAGEAGVGNATIVHNLKPTNADLGPDPDFAEVARSPRRAGRVGALESLLVVRSKVKSGRGVTVILRDVEGSSARATADSIERLTSAFVADCGGFGRLELSLCSWAPEVRMARRAALLADNMVLEIVPGQELPADLFAATAASEAMRRPASFNAHRH